MTKLGYISRYDLNDCKAWSGTIHNLKTILEREYEIIPVIVPTTSAHKAASKFTKLISGRKSGASDFARSMDKNSLQKRMRDAIGGGCRLFFAPAASQLLSSGGVPDDCKLVYLSDATYHAMVGYYNHDSVHDQKIKDNWEQLSIARADAIIYSSAWARDDALSFYKADESKVHVVPFPSNMRDMAADVGSLIRKRSERIKGTKKIHLLFVGVDWERKGTDIAIDAVEELNRRENGYTYELDVVGLDDQKGIHDKNIRFHGRLNKDNEIEFKKFCSLYEQADLFLLPTKAECAGIVFSEACMYGLPIISHETGGVGTYVESGNNGVLLPIGSSPADFADKIEEIVRSGKLEGYSRNARKKYEAELTRESWLKSFDRIVDSLR